MKQKKYIKLQILNLIIQQSYDMTTLCIFCPVPFSCVIHLFQDLHGKERDMLLSESKEKIATREKALTRANEVKAQLKI